MSLTPGTRLGPYEIVAPLGKGGMGEVYAARDTRLGRDVAIKIVPADLAADASASARFEQEARAIAALSHPNIVAIHDVGHEPSTSGGPGVAYAVMERLDGQTLRDHLDRGRLPLRKAVDVSLQIAQGLAAAHAKGIIHRDLKPENIFLTADGHVKILDFGLAKIVTRPASGSDETRIGNPTDAGMVLGTTGYLSPEQAQARPVDQRSDIFAFGAVLYEMTTGARAFKGDSTIDTLHRIVHSDPPPVDALLCDAPGELKWLLGKFLAKDPDERYQSTRDLVVDLRTLARALESSPRLSVASSPAIAAPPVVPPAPRAGSRALVPALVAALVVMAAAVAWLWVRGSGAPATDLSASTRLTIERITASGDVIDAAISPDGKYVAYVLSSNGQQSLWIRQLATASTLQLVPPAIVGYWGATFTPDGSAVDYVVTSASYPRRALLRVPTLGGTSRHLLDAIDSFPQYARDAKHMAFMRQDSPEPGSSAVWIADADGANPHLLASRKAPEFFVPLFFTAPAWSPDGTFIVCPMERRQGKTVGTLVAYRVSDGAEQPFPHYEWPSIGQAIWTRDGKAMVVIAGDGHNQQLWSISPVEVSRRRVTSDMLDYRVASMTDDGSQLVTVAAESTSSVWMAPIDGIGDAIRVSQGRYDGIDGIAAAPDHRVIYRSLESGSPNLWTMAEDGTGKSQVTTDGGSAWPMPIGDRTSMVYSRESDGLWLVGLDGQRPTKLSVPSDASNAVGTPDGKWIFFNTALSGTVELWKVATDGSVAPARVIDGLAARPAISPDGRQIAFYYRDPHATSTGLAVMPIDGPKPSRLYPVAPSSAWSTVRWTADGQGLLHNTAPKDRANIWLQPLAGGPLKQVTHFADQNIMSFDVSTDGKRLVIARGVLSRDAVLMKGFR